MSPAQPPLLNLQSVVQTLWSYRRRCLAVAGAITLAALAYALLMTPKWEASQALLVRDEATGAHSRPGQFSSVDAMQMAQKTMLELIRGRSVVRAALEEVGPPADYRKPAAWPTREDVEEARSALTISAPGGAEFGRTEMFYVSMEDNSRERAIALVDAVCRHFVHELQQVRDQKAESLIEELTKTATLAQADLDAATDKLAKIESAVGGDLAELRVLSESSSGEGNLRRQISEIANELRQLDSVEENHEQLLESLLAAKEDPRELIATPSRLLEAQPALRRMKDGLIDAQIRTAQLQGDMRASHPKVRAAVEAEAEIRRHLHQELATAIAGVRGELALAARRRATLEGQLNGVQARMARLAKLRADYENKANQVERRTEILSKAQRQLAEARAAHAAAHVASVITRIDQPTTGNYPVGPSRRSVALLGLLGGLAAGVGVVFLTAPIGEQQSVDSQPRRAEANGHAGGVAAPRRLRGLSLNKALSGISQSSAAR